MKIKFKNGSVVESIENTSIHGKTRGKRAEIIHYHDFKLKWYQRVYLNIYLKTYGLLSRFGYRKFH